MRLVPPKTRVRESAPKGIATACAVLVSVGCAAKSPPEKEGLLAFDAPGSYRSKGERVTAKDDDWVKQLSGDRQLIDLIKRVRENNWDIKKAAARVATAQANARIAGARMFPVASAGVDGQRAQQAFIGFPFGGDPAADGGGGGISKSLASSFGLSLDVSWELDLWGRIRTGQEAAIAEMEASKKDAHGVVSSLSAQTAKIWFALLEAGQQIDLAEDALESFQKTEDTLRDGFERGNGSAAQVRVASADVEIARALLEERRAQRRSAQRQLEVLLGEYPGAVLKSSGSLPEVPRQPPTGLPSNLLSRRSDIIAAERRVAAGDRRIKEAKLALLPQIKLTGSSGTASETLRELTNSDFGVWSIAGNFTQPIFYGGEVLANKKLREIAASEAYVDYQRVVLNAFQEVETRLDNEVVLRKREEALRAAERDLIAAYERSLEEYRTGVGSSTNLLLTQRQMLNTRGQVLTLRRLRLDNRVDLHLALGGSIKKTP